MMQVPIRLHHVYGHHDSGSMGGAGKFQGAVGSEGGGQRIRSTERCGNSQQLKSFYTNANSMMGKIVRNQENNKRLIF